MKVYSEAASQQTAVEKRL